MMHFRKEAKNGYYGKLWIYILIAVVPFVVFAVIITNGYIVGNGYKEFTTDLYQSVKNGIETDSLRAEYMGVSTRLIEKNAFHIANSIASSRFVNYRKNYEITDEIFFDFGDGNRMWLYPYGNDRMLIHFIYADGTEKTYITKEVARLVDYERLVSVEWGNSLWNE